MQEKLAARIEELKAARKKFEVENQAELQRFLHFVGETMAHYQGQIDALQTLLNEESLGKEDAIARPDTTETAGEGSVHMADQETEGR